jgi:Uma2 family endonuclease
VAGLGEAGPLVCFCRGDVFVEMSPGHVGTHALVLNAVNVTLGGLASEQGLGHYLLPTTWVTCPPAGLSTEPDGFLASFDAIRAGRIGVNPKREHELVGVPDMVLEVVSKSSRNKDTQVLRAGYAAAGVSEYWLIDARQETLNFQLLRLEGEAYAPMPADADGFLRSAVFGRSFRFLREEGPVGLPAYRLEHPSARFRSAIPSCSSPRPAWAMPRSCQARPRRGFRSSARSQSAIAAA